jgi:hypothetical protein
MRSYIQTNGSGFTLNADLPHEPRVVDGALDAGPHPVAVARVGPGRGAPSRFQV